MTFVERSEEMFFPMQDQNRMANFGSFVFAITVYVRRCFWPLKYTRRLYLFGTKTYFDVPRKRFFFFFRQILRFIFIVSIFSHQSGTKRRRNLIYIFKALRIIES